MHTEIFNNIDVLIEMSGTEANIDEMNTELITLRSAIKSKLEEIEDLKSIISDARYFNASNELVDKNIEISLKNKISRLNRKVKEMKTSIAKVQDEEQKMHEDIVNLKNKIRENTKYIEILKNKVENTNNNYYKELLKTEEQNNKLLSENLKEKNKEYDTILKELELNNQALTEINANLETEKNRLNDILDNLNNPNAYIDEDLKNSDKEKLDSLNEELSKLEKRELEILTDAAMIGSDAKELIAKNNISAALEKIKELVTIVKSKDYMDINNSSILDEELEKKETERMELSNLIDSKNYEGINSNSLNERVSYLEGRIEENNKTIAEFQSKINELDEFISNTLGNTISNLENESIESERTLEEYKKLLKEKTSSTKTKANLETAITKKEKENTLIDNILVSYKNDLLRKIEETNFLNNFILRLEEENKNNEQELTSLKSEMVLDFRTRDFIEEESDKEKLRTLNKEIKQIKNRQKYDRNPSEIYDQIEMLLSSIKPAPTLRVEKNKNKSLEIDSLFDVNPPVSNTSNRIKVIEMIPASTIKKKMGD